MSDVVVTVPKNFTHECAPGKKGLAAWIFEGDAAGDNWSGVLWSFSVWGHRPKIQQGERVYIVCEGRLRGYAPLVSLDFDYGPKDMIYGSWELVRGAGAKAVTIPERIVGFRGFRYRFWNTAIEIPFPDWKTP